MIRKLKDTSSDVPLKIELGKGSAVFILEMSGGEVEIIHTEPRENSWITKMLAFQNVKNCKFVGDENLLNHLVQYPGSFYHDKISKKVPLQTTQEVWFYPKTQKIRIPSAVASQNVKRKVLIIDDSRTIQKILTSVVVQSPCLEVMGIANNPNEAKIIIEKERPDIITLDIHMPEMDGVTFLKTYLRDTGIPVIMISSISMKEGPLVLEALSSGASTYIQKPSIEKLEEVSADILEKLETLSLPTQKNTNNLTNELFVRADQFSHFNGLIAIGSSTGGTQALEQLLKGFPDQIPPVVIVQHIPAVFSQAFADRLNTLYSFTVKEVGDKEEILPNTVYIAPGGKQLKLRKNGNKLFSEITDDPPVNRFKPSVDYLFESLCDIDPEKIVSVILTGMGKDGASGMLKLKNSGSYTIGQGEKSCVVYGMPRAAFELGATCEVAELTSLADRIVANFNQLTKKMKKVVNL